MMSLQPSRRTAGPRRSSRTTSWGCLPDRGSASPAGSGRHPQGVVGLDPEGPAGVLTLAGTRGRVRDPRALARGVDDPFLQPLVGPAEHSLDHLAVEVVGVGPQSVEEFLDTDAGL